jgi:hypothetical protein
MTEANRDQLFSVSSHHGPDAGRPPFFDGDVPTRRVSYFENAYGEQSLFVEDLETGDCVVWCGDAGWEPHPIRGGQVEDLRMTREEIAWVGACLLAAERRRGLDRRPVEPHSSQ